MPKPLIRRMRAGELEAVVGLWRRARNDAMPELEARAGHSPDDDLRHFREVVAASCELWVAAEQGEPRGLLALAGDRIEHLHVDPPAHRRGIGTALLDKARSLSPAGLRLFTHQANVRARAFYERRGFMAIAFGTSPAPENEPDVEYAWAPPPSAGRPHP